MLGLYMHILTLGFILVFKKSIGMGILISYGIYAKGIWICMNVRMLFKEIKLGQNVITTPCCKPKWYLENFLFSQSLVNFDLSYLT